MECGAPAPLWFSATTHAITRPNRPNRRRPPWTARVGWAPSAPQPVDASNGDAFSDALSVSKPKPRGRQCAPSDFSPDAPVLPAGAALGVRCACTALVFRHHPRQHHAQPPEPKARTAGRGNSAHPPQPYDAHPRHTTARIGRHATRRSAIDRRRPAHRIGLWSHSMLVCHPLGVAAASVPSRCPATFAGRLLLPASSHGGHARRG